MAEQLVLEETKQTIDQAKARLRKALSRLEDIVEQRLEEAKKSTKVEVQETGIDPAALAEKNKEIEQLKEKLASTEAELLHAWEENNSLQTALGAERESTKALRHISTQISQDLGQSIAQLESIVEREERREHASS